jgi:5'-3' exonuclease
MVSFGVEDFVKRYGALKPSQFVDVVALSGDKADNIPGTLYFYCALCYTSVLTSILLSD